MKKSLKTAIVGASPNPGRYSNMAAEMLTEYGHDIAPVSIKKGEVSGAEILDIRTRPQLSDIDTITMYVGPQNQLEYTDYLLSLKPRRIIFNPGSENYGFMQEARTKGIEVVEGCTLVMLRSGLY